MRVEDLKKREVIPQMQYLQSVGTLLPREKGSLNEVVTTYFYPSMVFPNRVELISVTLLHKCKNHNHEDPTLVKTLTLSVHNKAKGIVIPLSDKFSLKHETKELITTLKFPYPVILDAHQPFFFHHVGEMADSAITVAFRNFD